MTSNPNPEIDIHDCVPSSHSKNSISGFGSNTIRLFREDDWEAVWQILSPILSEGETYTFSPSTTQEEAYRLWIILPQETYVSTDTKGAIVGTYYIKPNQPALGAHICNCGYMVSPQYRGRGIAKTLCLHSLSRAKVLGFRGMQFNAVVSTNMIAVKLWHSLGFAKIGTTPKGFYSKTNGYVDSYMMFKDLITGD